MGAKSPILTPETLKGRKVKTLLDDNNRWMESKIMESFIQTDATDILNIPLGGPNVKDEIIWSHDKKGIFSVRSA